MFPFLEQPPNFANPSLFMEQSWTPPFGGKTSKYRPFKGEVHLCELHLHACLFWMNVSKD